MEHLRRGCSLCILHITSSYYVENELQTAVTEQKQSGLHLHKTRNKDSLNYSVKVLKKKKARNCIFFEDKENKKFSWNIKDIKNDSKAWREILYFLGMITNTYNPSTLETEVEKSEV